VFERYLNEVLASVPELGAQVYLPDHPQPIIQPSDLERALDQPRTLFPPG